MERPRQQQLVLIGVTIGIGLLSRKESFGLPLWIGDSLYAVLFYLGFGLLFPKGSPFAIGLCALGLCYAVEFAQLLQWHWLVELRRNRLGALVLGRGFLWSDLVAYFVGVLAAFLSECVFRTERNRR